jgi:hypothetical protein
VVLLKRVVLACMTTVAIMGKVHAAPPINALPEDVVQNRPIRKLVELPTPDWCSIQGLIMTSHSSGSALFTGFRGPATCPLGFYFEEFG